MKAYNSSYPQLILVLVLIVVSTNHILPQTDSTIQNKLIVSLISKLESDSVYAEWAKIECLIFEVEEISPDYYIIAVREKHGGKCQGDPDFSPTVDRFKISLPSKRIDWYSIQDDEFFPYEVFLLKRKGN